MAISRNININTRISLPVLDRLEKLAESRRVKPSDILRDALIDYLDTHKATGE